MLVITRREGEEVVIGDPANPIGVVRIASIKGDRVRVAFDFPRAIEVHRREVADQILSGTPQGEKSCGCACNGKVAESNGHAPAQANGHAPGHIPGHDAQPRIAVNGCCQEEAAITAAAAGAIAR
jgi:carbon storage regulator CsrA